MSPREGARRARLTGNRPWQVKARRRDAHRRKLADRLVAAVQARDAAPRKVEQRAGDIVVRLGEGEADPASGRPLV